MYHTETRFCPWPSHWAHIIHIPHTHDCYGVTSYIYHTHAHLSPWPSNWAFIIHGPHTHSHKILTPGHHFLGAHHTYTIYTHLSPWPSNWAFTIHGPHTHNYDSLAQLLGLHHSNTTYSQLLSHGPVTGLIWDKCQLYKHWLPGILFCAHIIYIPYTHISPPPPPPPLAQLLGLHRSNTTFLQLLSQGPVTGLIWDKCQLYKTLTPGHNFLGSHHTYTIYTHLPPWPSNWAFITHGPHTHKYDSLAQLLGLHRSNTTFSQLLSHGPVTGLIWHICHLHKTLTPGHNFLGSHHTYTIYTHLPRWLSNWAFIIHGPHTHNYDSLAQLLGLHHSNTTYSQLLSHGSVTGLIWHICHLHKTLTPGHHLLGSHHTYTIYTHISPWPSNWAFIIHGPHTHNYDSLAQLLGLHYSNTTYSQLLSHGSVTGLIWHICHLHKTLTPGHNFLGSHHTYTIYTHLPPPPPPPPGPVTGLSSYMDHIHTTMTPWPSYWACMG